MYSDIPTSMSTTDIDTAHANVMTVPEWSPKVNDSAAPTHVSSEAVELTPSATIRYHYYNSQHSDEDQEEQQSRENGWHNNSYYAPLKIPTESPKSYASSDQGSVISLRPDEMPTAAHVDTKQSKNKSHTHTIFKSKNRSEPKIVVQNEWDKNTDESSMHSKRSMNLLSKLSKTTAPIRAKISAMSRSASSFQLGLLDKTPLPTPLRRSTESAFHVSAISHKSTRRSKGERSQSFSFGTSHKQPFAMPPTAKSSLDLTPLQSQPNTIYPALLSQVALQLMQRITVGPRFKDSIEYKDAFDGKEVVDKLTQITRTKDRNVALLVGRALDAQKLFHDVNYEHRLRDSSTELYQFRQHITIGQHDDDDDHGEEEEDERSILHFKSEQESASHLPNGVFTLLTECYSPTCSRDNLCYSVFCPRRLEQKARKSAHEHMSKHSRTNSRSSLNEKQNNRLWISTVPKHVSDQLSPEERKRQENIFELIYTERDFINDLAYVNKFWIEPLLQGDFISADKRQQFVTDVFWNIMQVYQANSQLSAALDQRQMENHVVDLIGDIMLRHVASFGPFVQYGAHQIVGKYVFEMEKSRNPEFAKFVETTERLPQSRKLELNGYLTKPITRLGRYNLLLREILKHTPEGHPDKELIPRAMNVISEFLCDVNHETGKTENAFNLQLLADKLATKVPSQDIIDLNLNAEHREILMKGSLKKKGSGPSDSTDLHVYLLDHYLLVIKPKFIHNVEYYKIYKKPIPLSLLSISIPDQMKRGSTILPYGRPNMAGSMSSLNSLDPNTSLTATNKSGYPITFNYLGRRATQPITLYAPTLLSRRQWIDKVQGQCHALMSKQKVFDLRTVSAQFFNSFNRVYSAATFGKSVMLGGDQGVYIKKDSQSEEMVRILAMEKVSQIDVLESSGLMLVLADKNLYTYSLDHLLANDPVKRGRKLSSHVSFFKVGTTHSGTPGEKTLVCFVRHNAMSSTIQVLEPHAGTEKKHRSKIGRLIHGSNEGLKLYKSLYLPAEASSIQYFKNIICVGCPKGFQMVDLASTDVQSVLDPEDQNHQAILQRENLKPLSMFRHPNGNILLCYNELALYIDKKGRRARGDFVIQWEGQPNAFSWCYPYLVAFDPTFIEVRNIDTGALVQVIPGKNIRCLHPNSLTDIYCVMDDPVLGTEVVYQLTKINLHEAHM